MSLAHSVGLLACPVCRKGLTAGPTAVRCANGHSFDIARHGYVNLLQAPEPANADTTAMIQARARVHQAAVFAPVRETISELAPGRMRVLEVGAGTGHYLTRALADEPEAIGLAVDVSKAAARHCAHSDPRVTAVIADVWRGLPIRDHCLQTVLTVFAPRNLAEFSRVLRSDGRLVTATPRPEHLAEVRAAHGLLDVPAAKADQLADSAAEFFDLIDTRVISYRRQLNQDLVADLIAMGPNAFHGLPDEVEAMTVGISVTVQVFRPLLG